MNYKRIVTLLILSIVIVLFSSNFGIFWDNILFVSHIGNTLYENGIFSWNAIPIQYDPGHPPFLATFLASAWKLSQRSLEVSHWVMLPFIFGVLWQIYSFVSFFVKQRSEQNWAFLLVIADPTLLAQLTLVNHEIIQLFFFFVSLNAVLSNNYYTKIVGLCVLGIVSLRGMMLCAGVFLIDLLIHLIIHQKPIKQFLTLKNIGGYVIGALPATIFLAWRLIEKGWIIANPLEAFGNAWEFSSNLDFIRNFIKNILSFGQQMLDFGRISLFVFIGITLILKRKTPIPQKVLPIILIAIFSTVVVYAVCIIIRSPMGHYYFLPSILSLGLLSFLLLREYKHKTIIYITLISCLLLGNFVVYPDSFAQGWHSSLAHVPYWKLRKDAIDYMDKHQLLISETASFFPNNTTIDNIDLNDDNREFIPFTGKERFVFYSNVYNLSDENLNILNLDYKVIQTFKKRNVRIDIMQKRDNITYHFK